MKKAIIIWLLLLLSSGIFALDTVKVTDTILPSVILNQTADTDYVYISILAKTGPANESNSTAGFSALIASMLLTETRNKGAEEMQQVFYNLNGSMTIGTTLDYTEIRLLTVRRSLTQAMHIIGECLTQPKFTADGAAKAGETAFEGMVKEADTPFQQTYDTLRLNMYGTSPYRRSMYGNANSIRKASPKNLYSFFNENFNPNQLILAVSGNITPEELKKAVETSFFRVQPSPSRRSIHKYSETIDAPGTSLIANSKNTSLYYMLGYLAPSADEEDYYPMTVLSAVLGSGKQGRLFRDVRQKYGWGYSIGCRYPSLLRQSHLFIYISSETQKNPDIIRTAVLEAVESLKNNVTEEDVRRAVNYLITQEEIDRENLVTLTHSLAEEEFYGISFNKKAANLRLVTPEQVMACAGKYLTGYREVICRPE